MTLLFKVTDENDGRTDVLLSQSVCSIPNSTFVVSWFGPMWVCSSDPLIDVVVLLLNYLVFHAFNLLGLQHRVYT